MALPKIIYLGCFLLSLAIVVEAATPPGIANNPAKASCKIKKYKMCYNLEHVCPKFCPDGCEVECASCKPICTSGSPSDGSDEPETGSSPPPPSSSEDDEGEKEDAEGKGDDDGKGDDKDKGEKEGDDNKKEGKNEGDDDKDEGEKDDNNDGSPPYYPPTPTTTTPSPVPPTPSTPPTPPTPLAPPAPLTPPTPPTPATPPTPPTPSTPPTTPSTPSSPPTSSSVASRKRVRCKNKDYGQCYNQEYVCPANCPTSCQVDCASCKPVCNCDYPGAVCQDPRFIGGDGITFYFHGKKDKDFCLVSDPNLHINAHFIGKRNEKMSRDFTWVQSIGILFDSHRLFLGAKKTSAWDDAKDRLSLAFDGEPIFLEETLGSQWTSSSPTTTTPQVSITRTSTANTVVIQLQGKLKITAQVVPITDEESMVHSYGITKEDSFAHLDLGFKFFTLSGGVDGILGKTYRDDYVSRVKMGAAVPVMGGDREYSTSSIFATDCLASRFDNGEEDTYSLETLELASLNCASGMNGQAVVCKR